MRYRKGGPLVIQSRLVLLLGDIGQALIWPIGLPLSKALYGLRICRPAKRLPSRAVLVSNHCMPLDPLFHGIAIFPRRTFFTLLEETCEAPVLGTFVRTMGGIPLPRDQSRLADIRNAVDFALRTRGFVHFYPEGECFLGNQNIFPFKAGAFYFAIEAGVPVMPVVSILRRRGTVLQAGATLRAITGNPHFGQEQVSVHVLEPIQPPPRGPNDRATLVAAIRFARQVQSLMQAEIDRQGGDKSLYRGPMPRIKGVND